MQREDILHKNGKQYHILLDITYDEEGTEIGTEISREEIVDESVEDLKQEVADLKAVNDNMTEILGSYVDAINQLKERIERLETLHNSKKA